MRSLLTAVLICLIAAPVLAAPGPWPASRTAPAHAAAAQQPPPGAPAPQTAAGPSVDQLAVYWHAKYLVAQQQLMAAEDQGSNCPDYLRAAAQTFTQPPGK